MFTGLIEEIGEIASKKASHDSIEYKIKASLSFCKDIKIGDSISIAGVCQTVTHINPPFFSFYSSPTTLAITTLKNITPGKKINLEKALLLGNRLDGHFVYGHVQATGTVIKIQKNSDSYLLEIHIPKNLSSFLINKGSIALDGVSLTIVTISLPTITVSIIPHTWEKTTLSQIKPGSMLNIETDPLLSRIKEPFSPSVLSSEQSLKEALLRQGFIK